jgi:hypothetical protein
MHKGFKCLEASTGCIYTSRDVVFDENIFPFTKLHPNTGAKLRAEILLLSPSLIPSVASQGVNIIDELVTNPPNQEHQISGVHSGVQVAANNGVQIAFPIGTSPSDDSTQRVQPPATTVVIEIHEDFLVQGTALDISPGVNPEVDTLPPESMPPRDLAPVGSVVGSSMLRCGVTLPAPAPSSRGILSLHHRICN